MLFLVKFNLMEFDLSLASRETRRSEFKNVSRSSVTRSFVFARNDLSIIWIISFDQLGDEQSPVQIEGNLSPADAHLHVAFVGQQTLQFSHRFGRNNDLGFVAARKFQFDIHHGEPATVRRHQRQFVFFETEEHAVEDVARFIRRDGVGGFAQPIAQILLSDSDDFRVFKFRQRRKLLFGQAENLEETLAAADRGGILAIDVDLNFAGGQFADDR